MNLYESIKNSNYITEGNFPRTIHIKEVEDNYDSKFRFVKEYEGFGVYERITPSGYVEAQSYLITNGKDKPLISHSFCHNNEEDMLDIIDKFNSTGHYGVKIMDKGDYLIIHDVGGKLDETAEGVEKFWDKGFKVGDKVQTSGAGEVEIIDMNKDADYILIKRPTGYQPFVAAWAPSFDTEKGSIYWGQGHYFSNEEDAKNFFNTKLNDSDEPSTYDEIQAKIDELKERLNYCDRRDEVCATFGADEERAEIEEELQHYENKIDSLDESNQPLNKEGEYEDIYGEPTDYTEMRKLITALRSICGKAEEDGFNFVDKFKKAITDLSDVCADIEDFYEGINPVKED